MGSEAMLGMTQSGGMMGGGMLLGWLVPLLVLAGLTVLVVWAIRKLSGDRDSGSPEDDALRTARRRYARGEIDREEFERLREDLSAR